MFDRHDESYFEWRDAGLRSCTLVHVDAHHDMEPASPSGAIDIGNYVRAAIRDGIVARMCWVVPDPMWDAADQRERLLGELRNAAPAVDVQITPLADLATVEAPVLLDIDLDFLFTARFDRDPALGVLHDPWLWPDALVDALATRCPRRAMTTIATSVTGAFTPLAWKSLGAELAARMDGLPIDRDGAQAAREFRQAERDMRAGLQDDARAAFRRAVAVDPEYRHPFRTLGHHRLGDGRVAEAAECFASALALDPDDHWAKLGLAVIALDAGRPRDADALLTDIPADLDSIDCLRARARTLAAIGNAEDAIAAYRRVLKAALVGAVPLSVWTSNRDRHLVDPGHWRDHAALAALCERAGDAASASAHRRIAAAAGVTGIDAAVAWDRLAGL